MGIYQQKIDAKIGNASKPLHAFCHIHIIDTMESERPDDGVKEKLKMHTLGYLRDIKGIYSSIGHEEACSSLELPSDRIGDIVLLGDIDTVFGDDSIDEQ